MINKNPLISIIMPAFNAEKLIKESIDSVMNQSFKEWELIIINDGSTDDTKSIVKEYDDERIILISQQNGGVGSARNKGLEIVKGKYITFLDADDTLPENSFKNRFEYLESNSDIDLVDGVVEVKNENLNKILRTYKPYYTGRLLPQLLRMNDRVFLGVCYFFKSNLIKDIKFSEHMTHGEDLLFYIKLAATNDLNYGYINQNIYFYRSNSFSTMANLQGLENGYIKLLQEVKILNCTTSYEWLYLKLKIIRVMFLSWLSQKKYMNAFSSILNIIMLRGKS